MLYCELTSIFYCPLYLVFIAIISFIYTKYICTNKYIYIYIYTDRYIYNELSLIYLEEVVDIVLNVLSL